MVKGGSECHRRREKVNCFRTPSSMGPPLTSFKDVPNIDHYPRREDHSTVWHHQPWESNESIFTILSFKCGIFPCNISPARNQILVELHRHRHGPRLHHRRTQLAMIMALQTSMWPFNSCYPGMQPKDLLWSSAGSHTRSLQIISQNARPWW